MKIVRTRDDINIIDGTFYMVQRADVGRMPGSWRGYVTDKFGNPRVEWPGRSIWRTEAEAVTVAKRLATRYPQYPFVVMKAIMAVAATPVQRTVTRRLK